MLKYVWHVVIIDEQSQSKQYLGVNIFIVHNENTNLKIKNEPKKISNIVENGKRLSANKKSETFPLRNDMNRKNVLFQKEDAFLFLFAVSTKKCKNLYNPLRFWFNDQKDTEICISVGDFFNYQLNKKARVFGIRMWIFSVPLKDTVKTIDNFVCKIVFKLTLKWQVESGDFYE